MPDDGGKNGFFLNLMDKKIRIFTRRKRGNRVRNRLRLSGVWRPPTVVVPGPVLHR